MDTMLVACPPEGLSGGDGVVVCLRPTPPDDAFSADPDAPLPPTFTEVGSAVLKPVVFDFLGPQLAGAALLEAAGVEDDVWILKPSAGEDVRRCVQRVAVRATNDYGADYVGENAAGQRVVCLEVDT